MSTPGTSAATGVEDVGPERLAELTVSAGRLDRDHTIVSFEYPAGVGRTLALRDAAGVEQPLQVDAVGTATFVLAALAAGEEATFALVPASVQPSKAAVAAAVDDVVRLSVAGETVVDFQLSSECPAGVDPLCQRGGYLHPLYTPRGVLVTDDYPDDHAHHHGIWTAWARAKFEGREVDFWNVQANRGRVDIAVFSGMWRGPVHAGLDAMLVHVDRAGQLTTALDERWVVRVYKTHQGIAPYFVFDLDSTQRTASTSPVELLEYHYGGLAIRGHAGCRDVESAVFLTSEGLSREAGEGTGGRWCFIGGKVGQEVAGCAALGHPDNFRAPQKMRIHPTDPYVAFAPVKDGPFSIEPGTPYVTRFRFVTMDGAPDARLLERLWNDYATPPVVTLGSSAATT